MDLHALVVRWRRRAMAALTALLFVLLGLSRMASAQSMADYTATPPFVSQAVPPNILLLVDNSGSMNTLASDGKTFSAATTYNGIFDSTKCYAYDTTNLKFTTPHAQPCTSSYPWDGNLLNFVLMRRIDVAKWALTGGMCTSARDSAGNCGAMLKVQDSSTTSETISITVALATGHVPSGVTSGATTLYFHVMGSSGLAGSFCVDNDSTQPSSSATTCTDSDGYAETKYKSRVDAPSLNTGILQQVGNKARFGLMEFNGTAEGGKVLSDVGSDVGTLVNGVETTAASTWTPLAESLYEATRYFAQIAPSYSSSDYSYTDSARDPYYFASPKWAGTAQTVKCCKSFVMIFTDGQPTQDLNIPDALKDYAHTAANHGTSTHCAVAAGCTSTLSSSGAPPKHASTSTTLHNGMTDHHDNCSAYYGGPTSDPCQSSGSHYLDDVAYFAHTVDLRQGTIPTLGIAGKDIAGTQSLSVYAFFAFGTGGNLLSDAAKFGGFEDQNGNNVPDLVQEWDKVNNLTGMAGSDGVPDNYFESSDADTLKDRLQAAITSILQRSSSGTSISVLATSTTGEGALYQSYFFPSTFEGANEIKWTGYTQGLFIDEFGNFREDTNGDGRLTYVEDKIVRSRYDTTTGDVKVDRYGDSNGDGKADGSATTVGLKDVVPIWEAGKQLALTDAANRNIVTWVDADNDGIVDTGEQIAFSTANAATLAPYLRADASTYTSTNIINFIRGVEVSGLRDRQITVSGSLRVWKLGDPIHSTPTVVGAPKERYDVLYGDNSYTDYFTHYRARRQMVYVGANDGMLHAFNAGFYHRGDDSSTTTVTEHGWFTKNATSNSSGDALGTEKWGFVPYQLLPQLKWLADPNYTHVYFVDLKPKVTDARIFTPDDDHPNGWGTVLIAGMRFGGSCGGCGSGNGPPMSVTADFGSGVQTRTFLTAYFALDITNPESDPKLLWSFTDSSLGMSTSYPTIVRVNPKCAGCSKTDNTTAKWLMLVGSGPTTYEGTSTQHGRVYAVDLATGAAVTSYDTGDTNTIMGSPLTVDLDLDYRVDTAYIGNAIDSGLTPRWVGKLYRLTTGGCVTAPCTTTGWGGAAHGPTLLLSTFPNTTAYVPGPILASPTVTLDDGNHLWLFFGTGRYLGTADKTLTETQYLFGIKDPVPTGGCTESSVSSCEKHNLLDVSNATVCVICVGISQVSGISGIDTIEGNTSNTLQGRIAAMDGWYTTLPTSGERNVNSPLLLGGIVFFPTFVPSSDICEASGEGYLYGLFYLTGTAYKDSVVGTEASGSSTEVKRSIALGEGLPSQMSIQIGVQGQDGSGTGTGAGCQGQVTLISQSSTGAASQVCGKTQQPWSRLISWIYQRD